MNEMPFTPPPSPLVTVSGKLSKIGIASFVLGLVAVLLFCAAFLLSFGYGISLAANNPYFDPATLDLGSPIVLIASGLFYCSPVFNLIGTGLGIAAVFQKTDKKTFGIIGLVINGVILLSLCALFGIGLIVQSGSLGL
jgi:hypothetical protein